MPDNKPLPVIVVTRNSLHLSKRCIKSVLAQDVPIDLLVVDNQSSDGTRQWLTTKQLATIFTDVQWSLAKCWNVALKALWREGYTEAILANNDIVMRRDCASLLRAHGGPCVSCVSVNSEDQIGEPGDRSIETLRGGERPRPDFSCFLIRKSVTDKVGWFDEDCWPAFFEDNFFHKTMHDNGIRAVCIDLPFLHFGSSTVKNCDEREKRNIQRGATINKEKFRKRYGCVPADTSRYDALFSDATFGMLQRVTTFAEPLKI